LSAKQEAKRRKGCCLGKTITRKAVGAKKGSRLLRENGTDACTLSPRKIATVAGTGFQVQCGKMLGEGEGGRRRRRENERGRRR
jgi:hypothetical protein